MVHVKGIDESMIANNLTPFYQTHPGEVLKDELEARGILQRTLANNMGISYKVLNDILNERRSVSIETALLFEAALGISAHTLLGLQTEYDMAKTRQNKSFMQRLSSVKRVAAVF